jgi:nicotinate-nucleotide pyrophosphorylase (carboxylating)
MRDGIVPQIESDHLDRVVAGALDEDIGHGDLTTESLVDSGAESRAHLLAGQDFVLAGLDVFSRVFLHLDRDMRFVRRVQEGDRVRRGEVIIELAGRSEALFKGERTALNFLQHLSGVATRTRMFLDRIEGLPVTLLDTRKTTPGLRFLEKYAVRIAGAGNHRFGLFDGILIKDNHRKVIPDLTAAVKHLKDLFPLRRVEVECADLEEVRQALDARADIIMLDNMDLPTLVEAVRMADGRCLLEASGNISMETLESVAGTGVQFISAGTIIHGATFVDVSLEFLG